MWTKVNKYKIKNWTPRFKHLSQKLLEEIDF